MKSLPNAIVLLGILLCAAHLTAQNYKGSMTYSGPRGLTATPLVVNLNISGSSISGTLGTGPINGAAAANMTLSGTRTGSYCKVTAAGGGGAVFEGTCTPTGFSGVCTVGSQAGNFNVKADRTVLPQTAHTPITTPPPAKPTPPAPIPAHPTTPAPTPAQPTPPAPIPARPPSDSVSAPPPCANPIPAPPEPSSGGAPPSTVTNPPHPTPAPTQEPAPPPAKTPAPTPASQPVLYCGTFTNTTFHFTGYLEIRVDAGSSFSGEVSVGQAISNASRSTFGSGTFTGFRTGASCGATDSGGLQFKGTCTATSISTNLYSIDEQSGSFSLTTAGCAKEK